MLNVFDSVNYNYFNAKPKKLEDKLIPDSLVCLKIAKRHIETSEMKDRIIRESLTALTHYYAVNSSAISFPEIFIPASYVLRKFKKATGNNNYR
jgi:hypothetical protein